MTYSVARNRATQKYKSKNYKRIPLDVPISKYEEIKAFADAHGETVNGFIKRSIDETMYGDRATDETISTE